MSISRVDIEAHHRAGDRLTRPRPDSTCVAGESLAPGDHLVAPGGEFIAVMRPDGVVATYHVASGAEVSSVGAGPHPGALLQMQDDGDLVITSAGGNRSWRSQTGGHPGAYVRLRDDGRLSICDFYGDELWISDTQARPDLKERRDQGRVSSL